MNSVSGQLADLKVKASNGPPYCSRSLEYEESGYFTWLFCDFL